MNPTGLSTAYQDFLLFTFSFSLRFAAFLRRASSSLTLTPSTRASAFAQRFLSSITLRLSSGIESSFSFRAASCDRAWLGLEDVLSAAAFLLELPAIAEKVTLVKGPSVLRDAARLFEVAVKFGTSS